MDRLGGIAVWLELKQAPASPAIGLPRIELHFNYWRMDNPTKWTQQASNDFLDIGIRIEKPQVADAAWIYIPLPAADIRVMDLGPQLANADTAQGIFNQIVHSTTSSGADRWITLTNAANRPFCRVHRFLASGGAPAAQELEFAAFSNGTGLKITTAAFAHSVNGLRVSEDLYFRIRLTLDNRANPFLKIIRPKDRLFLSGFDVVEYVDFRMNEARTLPDDVESAMQNAAPQGLPWPDIKALHFLVAIPVAADLTGGYPEPAKSRLLERQLWNQYVGGALPEGMAIYHWKKTPERLEPIKEFAVFVKLRIRRTGIGALLGYLAVAFAFAIAGNLVASMIEQRTAVAPLAPPPAAVKGERQKPATQPAVVTRSPHPKGQAKGPSTNQQEESNAIAPR